MAFVGVICVPDLSLDGECSACSVVTVDAFEECRWAIRVGECFFLCFVLFLFASPTHAESDRRSDDVRTARCAHRAQLGCASKTSAELSITAVTLKAA